MYLTQFYICATFIFHKLLFLILMSDIIWVDLFLMWNQVNQFYFRFNIICYLICLVLYKFFNRKSNRPNPQAHGAWISFPPPPFFQNFHINHSFFKIFIIIRFFFIWQYQLTSYIMNNTCILCPQFFDWYSIREKVSNSIFIFRAISLTSVGKPPCFLHFLPCLHMTLSYQTVSKTLT